MTPAVVEIVSSKNEIPERISPGFHMSTRLRGFFGATAAVTLFYRANDYPFLRFAKPLTTAAILALSG
jgi:hypothetical protein